MAGGLYFWGHPVNGKPVAGGPIFLTSRDDPDDKHPIDPWGRPYLFFGPGKLDDQELFNAQGTNSGTLPVTPSETEFGNSVIYSMGNKDRLPGNNQLLTPDNLLRENRILGEKGSDDLFVQF